MYSPNEKIKEVELGKLFSFAAAMAQEIIEEALGRKMKMHEIKEHAAICLPIFERRIEGFKKYASKKFTKEQMEAGAKRFEENLIMEEKINDALNQ